MKSRYLNFLICLAAVATLMSLQRPEQGLLTQTSFSVSGPKLHLQQWANDNVAYQPDKIVSEGLGLEVEITKNRVTNEPVALVTLVNSGDTDLWIPAEACLGWIELIQVKIGKKHVGNSYTHVREDHPHGAILVKANTRDTYPFGLKDFMFLLEDGIDFKVSIQGEGWPEMYQYGEPVRAIGLDENQEVWNGSLKFVMPEREFRVVLWELGFPSLLPSGCARR